MYRDLLKISCSISLFVLTIAVGCTESPLHQNGNSKTTIDFLFSPTENVSILGDGFPITVQPNTPSWYRFSITPQNLNESIPHFQLNPFQLALGESLYLQETLSNNTVAHFKLTRTDEFYKTQIYFTDANGETIFTKKIAIQKYLQNTLLDIEYVDAVTLRNGLDNFPVCFFGNTAKTSDGETITSVGNTTLDKPITPKTGQLNSSNCSHFTYRLIEDKNTTFTTSLTVQTNISKGLTFKGIAQEQH